MNTRASHTGAPERKNGNKPPAGVGRAPQQAPQQARPAEEPEPNSAQKLKAKVSEQWEEGSAAAAQLADSVSEEIKSGVSEAKQAMVTAGESLGELASDARTVLEKTGRSVVQAVKNNPVPTALIGLGCAGLGMLLVDALRPAGSRRGRGARPLAQGTQSSSPGEARQGARQALSTVAARAGQQTERLQGLIERNPLKAGAGGIAIGIGVGLLIPSMDREHQWLGKGRDQLVERTQQLAHNMLEKLENAGQTITEIVGGGNSGGGNNQHGSETSAGGA